MASVYFTYILNSIPEFKVSLKSILITCLEKLLIQLSGNMKGRIINQTKHKWSLNLDSNDQHLPSQSLFLKLFFLRSSTEDYWGKFKKNFSYVLPIESLLLNYRVFIYKHSWFFNRVFNFPKFSKHSGVLPWFLSPIFSGLHAIDLHNL